MSKVGIAGWDGSNIKYYSIDEWKELPVKPDVMGTYIYEDGVIRIIYPNFLIGEWASPFIAVPGCFLGSLDAGKTDFGGDVNTDAVIKAYNDGIITDLGVFDINAHPYINGDLGYIISGGESLLIHSVQNEFNEAQSIIGGDNFGYYTSIRTSSQGGVVDIFRLMGSGMAIRDVKTGNGKYILMLKKIIAKNF